MTLIEEKTLADHDINVRAIRQELQLLEEQLKKHGRNEGGRLSEQVLIRAEIIGENAAEQKHIRLLANNADGIHFWTDDKSIVRFIEPDTDTISRKAAIKAIRDTYRVSYPIDMISKDDAADVLTELPSVTLTITADTDTISRQEINDDNYCSYAETEVN